MKLTKEQIEEVIKWMNTWEQLKNTAIPMRFKEDFTEHDSNTVLAASGLPGLYKIRNHFVTTLPTGEVTAWDMICWAKDFTRYMDEIIHEAEKAACASGAVDTVAEGGTCPYANHDLHLKLFGYCNACETQIARKSSEGQP